MDTFADHLRLPRLEQLRVRAEGIRATVSRQSAATARTFKEACDAFSRARAGTIRLVSAAQSFWEYDLLMAALVMRGHGIDLTGGEAPHLVIDGVHATFAEATAFHRGLVTLTDIDDWGALSGRAPECAAR